MYRNFHRAEIVEGRPLSLYDLSTDISEAVNVAEQYPEVVRDLMNEADKARSELGDFSNEGKAIRPAAIVGDPKAQLLE